MELVGIQLDHNGGTSICKDPNHVCHNFLILTAQRTQGTTTTITEIRRTPKSPWYTETVLPKSSLPLPGTDIACTIANNTISLYYQDHNKNIKYWLNQDNKWTGKLLLRAVFHQENRILISAGAVRQRRRY